MEKLRALWKLLVSNNYVLMTNIKNTPDSRSVEHLVVGGSLKYFNPHSTFEMVADFIEKQAKDKGIWVSWENEKEKK